MSGRGDQQVDIALARLLADGPADVLCILDVLRRVRPKLFAGQEGSIHGFLQARVRRGTLKLAGRSESGLAQYATVSEESVQSHGSSASLPALDAEVSRTALQVAKGVRDEADRGRVLADVVAHLTALDAADQRKAFGPTKRARQLLQRGDRDKRSVFFTADGGDGFRRFLFHEGPWILGAVVLFLVVKFFIAEVYQIPSESMRPTLEVGDRVLVSRLGGAPDRWDVVVFQHGGKAVVKRLAGFGGEQIAIWNGDVYIDDKLVVKPADLAAELRHPIHASGMKDGRLPGWDQSDGDGMAWWTHMAPEEWSGERNFHPNEPLSQPLPLYDGYLTVRARRPAGGVVSVKLQRGLPGTPGYENAVEWMLDIGDRGIFLMEVDHDAGREPLILESGPTPAPGEVAVTLQYVDGVLTATGPGLRYSSRREAPYHLLAPHVGLRGGAELEHVQVDADIHYGYAGLGLVLGIPTAADRQAGRMNPYPIPPGHLFFLGDNSRDSKDSRSRDLGAVPADSVVGPVGFRIWPLGRLGSPR